MPIEKWQSLEYVKDISNKGPVIAKDKYDNVFMLTTQTDESPALNFTLAKYDSTGQLLWKQQHTDNIFKCLYGGFVVDSNGNAFISAAYGLGFSGVNTKAILLKYNTNGEKIFEINYGDNFPENSSISHLNIDPNGHLIALGASSSTSNIDNNYLFTACFDSSNGDEIWCSTVPGVFGNHGLRVFNDQIETLSTAYLPDHKEFVICRFDPEGQLLEKNSKTYTGYELDFNRILKTGEIIFGDRGLGYNVTKVTTQGDTLWRYSLPNISGTQAGRVLSITEDDSLNIYVTGAWAQPQYGMGMTTTKLALDGEVIWQHIFNFKLDSLFDSGQNIYVDKQNSYVIGGNYDSSGNASLNILVYENHTGKLLYQVNKDLGLFLFGLQIIAQKNGFVYTALSHNLDVSTTSILTGEYMFPTNTSSILNAEHDLPTFSIFPSPARNSINIACTNCLEGHLISICAYNGERVLDLENHELDIPISVESLMPGVYFVVFKVGTHQFTKGFFKSN